VNAGFAGVKPTFLIPCSDEAVFAVGEADYYRCPPANRTLAGAAQLDSAAKKKASPESYRG